MSWARSPLWLRILVIGLVLGLVVALTYANFQFVNQEPGGNDFLAYWMAANYWLTKGIDPYSDEVLNATQEVVFGRSADIDEGEDASAFVNPLPSMIIFGPFGLLPFPTARAIWMTLLEVGLILLAILSLQISGWQPSTPTLFLWILFGVLWYHGLRSVVLGQITVFEALLIIGSLYAIHRRADIFAGVLLGFTIIKPQMAFLLIPFLLGWAVLQARPRILIGFMVAFLLQIVVSLVLLPDWPINWLRRVVAYPEYTVPVSPLSYVADLLPWNSQLIVWILSGLLILYLIWEWLTMSKRGEAGLQWVAALTLLISIAIFFRTATTNYVMLLPGIAIIFATMASRWGRASTPIIWMILLIILGSLWWIFGQTVMGIQEAPIMYIPVPVLIGTGLLWARWWYTYTPPMRGW